MKRHIKDYRGKGASGAKSGKITAIVLTLNFIILSFLDILSTTYAIRNNIGVEGNTNAVILYVIKNYSLTQFMFVKLVFLGVILVLIWIMSKTDGELKLPAGVVIQGKAVFMTGLVILNIMYIAVILNNTHVLVKAGGV